MNLEYLTSNRAGEDIDGSRGELSEKYWLMKWYLQEHCQRPLEVSSWSKSVRRVFLGLKQCPRTDAD